MDGRLSDQRMTILDSRSAQMNGGWPISIESTKWGATFKVLKWTILWSFYIIFQFFAWFSVESRHMFKLQILYKYTWIGIHMFVFKLEMIACTKCNPLLNVCYIRYCVSWRFVPLIPTPSLCPSQWMMTQSSNPPSSDNMADFLSWVTTTDRQRFQHNSKT